MPEKAVVALSHERHPVRDLRTVAQALLVAEHRSFRQAANALGVRPSAVSRRVRSLEDALGVSLFERHHRGVRITAAGAQFLNRMSCALSEMDHAAQIAAAAGRGECGHLCIAVISSVAVGFLRELILTFREQHKQVTLQFSESTYGEYVASIGKGLLDVAFVMGVPIVPSCETTRLWNERLFVVLPQEHLLCAREKIEWSALSDEHIVVPQFGPGPIIQDLLINRFTDLCHHPRIQILDVGRETLMDLVGLGLGVSLATEGASASCYPGVEFRPIADDRSVIPMSGVWSPSNDNPAFRRFLSLARVLSKKWNAHSDDIKASATSTA